MYKNILLTAIEQFNRHSMQPINIKWVESGEFRKLILYRAGDDPLGTGNILTMPSGASDEQMAEVMVNTFISNKLQSIVAWDEI